MYVVVAVTHGGFALHCFCFSPSFSPPLVQDAFRTLMKVGALAVPCAFLINGEGKIVWRQSYSAGYPFATMGFYAQLKRLLAGEELGVRGFPGAT